jgi:hypothetical protein
VIRSLVRGALAGAAGTTALNALTYIDMAARGRPASQTPQQAVDAIAQKSGHPVPGHGEQRENRLAGLGPLGGIATGVGVGVAAGLLRPLLTRLPSLLSAAMVGGAAMVAANAPIAKLGITDPSTWSPADWASDVVPHVGYGVVTYLALVEDH